MSSTYIAYSQAQDSYEKALRLLDPLKSNYRDFWESISWELSSVYFNMATLLQDYAPLSIMAHEKVSPHVMVYYIRLVQF